ncbi:MAG TPA: hypothetical protein DCP28_26420, partial [Cytophagales bacterium]|nr:hypothetical protein [Cytophagales bacterium]
MTSPSEVLASIAEQQPDVYKLGKTFGNPCLKLVSTNKVPVMAREASIVLKLPQETINMLLKEEGNRMYIPMTGKPMKEWLEVPDTYAHRW